jgi:glycosyltransferase involved in cell wall biosynthesis
VKIVQLTTAHPWNDVRIYTKITKSLLDAGHEVHLIATEPESKPSIDVRGLHLHFLSQTKTRLGRLIKSFRAAKVANSLDADVIHFHDPELMIVATLLRFLGNTIVYDVHEDLPNDILQKKWIPQFLRRPTSLLATIIEWLFSRVIANTVVTVTPQIASRFSKNTLVLRNYPSLTEMRTTSTEPYLERPKTVTYIGGIEKSRGIVELIRGVELSQKVIKCHLELAGSIYPIRLSEELQHMNGWQHVNHHGWVSRADIVKILSTTRAGLVVLHPTTCFISSYPIKMFEYMAAGIPIIASDFPVWREILDRHQCGIAVDPIDPNSIADAMIWIFSHPEESEKMGERGRKAVEEMYNWETESVCLLDLYKTLEKTQIKRGGVA